MIRSVSLVSFLLLLGVLSFNGSLASASPDDQKQAIVPPAALTMYDSLKEYTLNNGLKVYLLPVPGSPVVTTMTAFQAGSCDEDKTATGLAHYLEHLMFKGTAKLRPGDIDRMTQRSGGSNNAYTNHDMTNYHFDFAADRWETALEIETERMRGLLIDKAHEFEQEKGAVIEELARNEDAPWDLEEKAILPMLFGKESPYGHPIIGEREHVRGATADVIKGYYNKWYHPNNATMIVVGGIDPDLAIAKIKAKLENIPTTALPERKVWPTKFPDRPARLEFPSKFPTARMIMGFTTIPQGHANEAALDIASMILASSKTSRLYKKLVLEERIAVEVGASHSPGRYPGWFGIQMELLPGKDRKKAEQIVLAEIRRLATEPVPANELLRIQRMIISQSIFSREGIHSLADSIAKTVLVQPASALKEQFTKWAAVTPVDIQRVAKLYLDADKPVVVWSIPKEEKGGGAQADKPKEGNRYRNYDRQPQGGAGNISLQQAKKVVLPNGLTLLLMENRRLPLVVAAASLTNVRRYEPAEKAGVAQLMGSLLEEGTEKRTGQQIAEAIDDVGGTISMVANGGSVKVLRDHKQLGLELLFDSLLHPSFPAEAFERKKDEQLAEIAEAQEQPLSRASEAFQETIYGKHFKGRPSRGSQAIVQKLTRDDVAAFHKLVMVPDNTALAIVGDFNSKEMIDLVTKLTANWTGKLPPAPETPELTLGKGSSTKLITMPNSAQLQFLMGHLGIKRNHPDYFKLLVMDNVLGSGAGFTDRLSSRIRDREGLAYTVNATITDSAELDPGAFMCYIGTDARNYQRVKQLFLEEIERLRKEIPSEYEVSSTKQYLLGKLAFMLTTSDSIAEKLLYVNRYDLGFDYFDKYRASVEAVTPAQVREMAEKYIQPGSFATVAAGAIDKDGRILPPPAQK
ncbi:MAG TPA: pitrilysin family protein [Gemmatales bacterium]|nr:pitrilysin family protein [Gemmatales bacterium]